MTAGKSWKALLICLVAAAVLAPSLTAQIPTGTIQGRITDADGEALPGVTVTASSPALQGSRVATTAANGAYNMPGLPAGNYTLTYELDGFAATTREVLVPVAQTITSNIEMVLREIAETITVIGRQETISEGRTGSSTVSLDEIDSLAVERTPAEASLLTPGVTATGPAGNLVISGAMSFQNLWLLNGVVINENVRGQSLPLFIEDAIQETTTSVSGISAEYGRFAGGVVNTITKSGGNEFTGSLRASLANEKWRGETPLTLDREDKINDTWEATLGGRFVRDRLWFFGAGRTIEQSSTGTTAADNPISFPRTDEEDRFEIKLTGALTPSHSVVGTYTEIERVRTNEPFGSVDIDLGPVSPQREDPQDITAFNYTGILTPNFFVEAQYSERTFTIGKGSGGVPDLIEGTLMRQTSPQRRFHAPVFCGECEDEIRDNENILVKGSYFLATDTAGSHDLVFGYDTFNDIRFSVNHQTGSDFQVWTESFVIGANQEVFPVLTGDNVLNNWIVWWPPVGLDIARPAEFEVDSFYANDSWQLNDKWSFNVGVRYDQNSGVDSGGFKVSDDDKISPRLGLSYDFKGDGDLVGNASYGTYVATLANTGNVADGASLGGNLAGFGVFYTGPDINTNCPPQCISSPDALRIIFDWYASLGGPFDLNDLSGFAPGTPLGQRLIFADIPGPSTIVPESFKSPSADEFTVGLTKRLGAKGMVRTDFVYRDWEDFFSERTLVENGQFVGEDGIPSDITHLGNFGDSVLERTYWGVNLQARYRVTDRLSLSGMYTLSQLRGNIEGETVGAGPVSASPFSQPEYRQNSWAFPVGSLDADQRHKTRAWAIYDIFRGSNHHLSASVMQVFESARRYSAFGTIDTRPFVTNPGYAQPPSTVTYFFSDRGAFEMDDVTRTDFSLNYAFRFNAGTRPVEIFFQPEVVNAFDEDNAIDVDRTVITAANTGGTSCNGAPCQPFNPFTETPIEGVHWVKGPNFGEPQTVISFQTPRIFRFSVGFRF